MQANRLLRSFSVRLNLWYVSIFTISACALYLFLYYLLSVAVETKDRDIIEAQLKEYATVYQTGGRIELANFIQINEVAKKKELFFVRLYQPNLGTFNLRVPEDWIAFDTNSVQLGNVNFQQITRY